MIYYDKIDKNSPQADKITILTNFDNFCYNICWLYGFFFIFWFVYLFLRMNSVTMLGSIKVLILFIYQNQFSNHFAQPFLCRYSCDGYVWLFESDLHLFKCYQAWRKLFFKDRSFEGIGLCSHFFGWNTWTIDWNMILNVYLISICYWVYRI